MRGMPNLIPPFRRSHAPLGPLAYRGSWRPLSAHGEVVNPEVDLFAREDTFIEWVLVGLLGQLQGLEVVLEYITTERRQPSCRRASWLAVSITS